VADLEKHHGPRCEQNCLTYPSSKYDNLRAGFPNDK